MVIIGGGLAAQRCAERLRRRGYDAAIRIVCDEPRRPYDRPPLSKEMLAGGEGSLSFRDPSWYDDNAVELLLGERAARLDARLRTVVLASGAPLRYDHLLIATGAAPRVLRPAERFSNSRSPRRCASSEFT